MSLHLETGALATIAQMHGILSKSATQKADISSYRDSKHRPYTPTPLPTPKDTQSTIQYPYLPRDRPPIQRLPLVLLNLVQFLPPSRSDLDGLGTPKLVGTLHQPNRPITYVLAVHLFPRFEVVFRVGEGYEAVSCLPSGKERKTEQKQQERSCQHANSTKNPRRAMH
jgi:hypothetical protein